MGLGLGLGFGFGLGLGFGLGSGSGSGSGLTFSMAASRPGSIASAAGATRLLSALETGTPARPVQGEAQTCEYQTAWGLLVWGSSPEWHTVDADGERAPRQLGAIECEARARCGGLSKARVRVRGPR